MLRFKAFSCWFWLVGGWLGFRPTMTRPPQRRFAFSLSRMSAWNCRSSSPRRQPCPIVANHDHGCWREGRTWSDSFRAEGLAAGVCLGVVGQYGLYVWFQNGGKQKSNSCDRADPDCAADPYCQRSTKYLLIKLGTEGLSVNANCLVFPASPKWDRDAFA